MAGGGNGGNGGEGGGAPLWVFGYGSLIWNPGFPFAETRPGRLTGYRRAFCLRSIRYRGTPEAPGLVLALDPAPEAFCRGLLYRVEPGAEPETRAYLRHREMSNLSYHEVMARVELEGGDPEDAPGDRPGERAVEALCYVMNVNHENYAKMPLEAQAEIIARAEGPAGPNRDYLHNTVAHLRALGLPDPELERLDGLVRARQGPGAS
ncbi:MAG: gamma-glutamylcyclotransferase [Pseudomonadota bacterium]|nr:gamma-glutamylcyclotransferase [Pseudomonadota bacterium]MEE3099392.1 gamma-glutamylcyclotransferase [Pseudomonadota bacterium]